MLDNVPPEKRLDYFDQKINHKRQVKLKTCADVYNYWRNCKRLYKKAPEDGVEFQIDYIDTGLALSEDVRAKAPIALALHGAPGSYHDFALLIHHLTQQNVRVIAPNFPEYVATVKTKVLFRHSADEKAAYLRDFLRAINVNKIDLLVSHSSAIFPTLLMLLNANQKAIAKRKQLQEQQQQQQQQRQQHAQHQGNNKAKCPKVVKQQQGKQQNDRQQNCDIAIKDVSESDNHRYPNVNEIGAEDVSEVTDDDYADTSECSHDEDADKFVDAKDIIDNNNNTGNKSKDPSVNNNNEDKENATQILQNDFINECDVYLQYQSTGGHIQQVNIDLNGATDVGVSNKRSHKRRRRRRRRQNQDPIVQFDQPIEVKAVALFNPAGHRLPKSMKPTWFKCGSVHIYQHKLGRSLFRKLGPAFLTVVGVPVKVDNMDNVMLSATVMRNSKCQRVVQQLEQLSQLQIPTLLVFSENDKLIEKEIFYEMTQFMKLDSKNFDIFNDEGDLEKSQSRVDDWIRVMVFKAGGHYAYSNYAKTVNKAVSELLMKVVSN